MYAGPAALFGLIRSFRHCSKTYLRDYMFHGFGPSSIARFKRCLKRQAFQLATEAKSPFWNPGMIAAQPCNAIAHWESCYRTVQ